MRLLRFRDFGVALILLNLAMLMLTVAVSVSMTVAVSVGVTMRQRMAAEIAKQRYISELESERNNQQHGEIHQEQECYRIR